MSERLDKLAQAMQLLEEINREIPDGMNFEFAVVELPTKRIRADGRHYWQAYEDQGITLDGESVFIDGDEISILHGAVDIADGLGAALIAASRYHQSLIANPS